MTYEEIHWGLSPQFVTGMKAFTGNAAPIGELIAISYVTDKADEKEVYRHAFDSYYCDDEDRKRGPYLLKAGRGHHAKAPKDLLAVGRAVDFELLDGRRVIASAMWVGADKSGKHIYLVSEQGAPFAIEQRSEGPQMVAGGITG